MEGATNEKTIHLIFKTPSLDTGEHHMESVPLFLTLRDLKEQLSCSFPSNPAVERQKLIYGGKILQDQMTLSEVFAQRDISTPHVLHLVISALKQPPPSASQTQIPPNPPPPFQQPQQQQQQPPQQPQGGFYPGGQFQQAPFVGQQFGFGGQGAYFQGGFHPPPQGGFPNQFYFQQGPNMGGMGQNFNPGAQFNHHHPQQRPVHRLFEGENVSLLIKLAFLVFLLSQGSSSATVFGLSLFAFFYYLYQTGRFQFIQFHFNIQRGNQPPAEPQQQQQQQQQNPPAEGEQVQQDGQQQPQGGAVGGGGGIVQEVASFARHFILSLLPTYDPPRPPHPVQ